MCHSVPGNFSRLISLSHISRHRGCDISFPVLQKQSGKQHAMLTTCQAIEIAARAFNIAYQNSVHAICISPQ